jgi:hypothetical protein
MEIQSRDHIRAATVREQIRLHPVPYGRGSVNAVDTVSPFLIV